MRKTLPPTSSLNSPRSLLLLISANFSHASSLWLPKAASRLDAPPFSLTSPISSSTLTPAIIPEDSPPPENGTAGFATRIAPFAEPEYPLFSHGGLGCESVWQGSGSALESSRQQFSVVRSMLLYVALRTRSNSTRRSASNTTR